MRGIVRLAVWWGSVVGLILWAEALGQGNKANLIPAAEELDRLNLRLEWSLQLPIEVNRDAITQFQTIDDQIFIQTRTGLFFALSARTGLIQWQKQLGNGDYTVTYPVAANAEYVFVTHVTKLYAFHRFTGTSEFEVDMGSGPTAGLAADNTGVYCVLGMRSGNSAAHRIVVYNLTTPITVPEQQRKGGIDPTRPWLKEENARPLDELMRRYTPRTHTTVTQEEIPIVRLHAPSLAEPIGGYTGSRTPSLSPLPRITPPYTLSNENYTPSLNPLPSLRQPYHLRNEASKYLQSTPSIGTIPPSVAAALALTDLRPQPIRPPVRWEYGLRGRVEYAPLITPQRVWVFLSPRFAYAFNKKDRTIELYDRMTDEFTAAPVQADTTLYIPISHALMAVDGQRGGVDSGVELIWRTPLPGTNNHSPYVTDRYVFASGDETGIVCLDRRTGRILWQSDPQIDSVIAANEEFVYARDQVGNLHIFDIGQSNDPLTGRVRPLASMTFRDYDVSAINTTTDRIYLVTRSGLVLCLRDKAAKYNRPVRIWPAVQANPRLTKDDKNKTMPVENKK